MRVSFVLITIVGLISHTAGAPAGQLRNDIRRREPEGGNGLDVAARGFVFDSSVVESRAVKKAVTAPKQSAIKKTAAKTVAPKKVVPKKTAVKKAAPVKKVTPVKKTSGVKKATPAKKATTPAKKATTAKPTKKTTTPTKNTTTAKKTPTPPKVTNGKNPTSTATPVKGAAKVCKLPAKGKGAAKGKGKRAETDGCTDTCTAHTTCAACVADANCGISRATFKCETKSSIAAADLVTAATQCGLMDQLLGLFPGGRGAATDPFEVTLSKIVSHVTGRDAGNDKTVGRHLKSNLLADNPDATLKSDVAFFAPNTVTQMETFLVNPPPNKKGKVTPKTKTVWIDTPEGGPYTPTMVADICRAAFKLGSNLGPVKEASFAIAMPIANGVNACVGVQLLPNQESCFPVQTGKITTVGLGQACTRATT